MTVPPGPVIPVPLLPSRRPDAGASDAGRRGVSPSAALNARGPEDRAVNGRFRPVRPMYLRPVDRTDLARRIYAAAHLTGTFTLRSGVVSHEYFDKYRFESDPALLADIAEARAAARPGRDRRPRRARARWSAARDDDLPGHAAARGLRPQGGEDLRHLPARRGRRGRRPAACASSRTSSPPAARSSTRRRSCAPAAPRLGPVICVIDRESGGREKLAAEDLELVALYTMSELKAAAAAGA